jgi:hypothetical protein
VVIKWSRVPKSTLLSTWGPVRMVDWMLINDFGPAATEIHLSLAETRLG